MLSAPARRRCPAARAVVLLALLLPSLAVARAKDKAPKDPDAYGKSALPIVGYDEKTGWLFGAAGFLYKDKDPAVNAGLFMVSNFDNFYSTTLNYEQRSRGPWSINGHFLAERAFDNYYGEGDLTPPDDPILIRMLHVEAKPILLYRLRPHLHLGTGFDLRSRREEDTHYFQDEWTLLWVVHLQWDTRNRLLNPSKGDYWQLDASRLPWDEAFTQVTVDLRRFSPLNKRVVLASRVSAGLTMEKPTYLFRYRLGGLDLLRGYKNNRFRGDDFVLIQEELRLTLFKWLAVNGSVDLGGIRDGEFRQAKITGQVGLRIGLPPDWGQKLRLDVGAGADQTTVTVQFGEVF